MFDDGNHELPGCYGDDHCDSDYMCGIGMMQSGVGLDYNHMVTIGNQELDALVAMGGQSSMVATGNQHAYALGDQQMMTTDSIDDRPFTYSSAGPVHSPIGLPPTPPYSTDRHWPYGTDGQCYDTHRQAGDCTGTYSANDFCTRNVSALEDGWNDDLTQIEIEDFLRLLESPPDTLYPGNAMVPMTPPRTPPSEHPHQLPSIEQLLPSKPSKKRRAGDHLYKFLYELLEIHPDLSLIRWHNRSDWSFVFVDGNRVARMWGTRKTKNSNKLMDYGKMTRAIRHYYKEGIMNHVDHQRKVYQFGLDIRESLASSNFRFDM